MKILTWNINGIRASKRSVKDVLDSLDSDVICLQETKITRDMLDEPCAIVEGYSAYFSFSRKRSGYSGTVNFCRDSVTPVGAEEGLSGQFVSHSEGTIGCLGNVAEFESEELTSLDGEGRAVITQHQIELKDGTIKDLAVINVYIPRAADEGERWTYKQRYLALLQSRAESLLRNGRHVIVLGDINTTHKRIDHCDPNTKEFLRIDSRQWIDQFLRPEDRDPDLAPISDRQSFDAILSDTEGSHFIDAFRFFYPEEKDAYTNWSTVTAARQTNYGKRLDYIFIDTGLQEYLADCKILADFEGSDHCPVVLELQCKPVPAKKCPPLCTKFMPEFQGKQQKLSSFFSKPVNSKSVTNSEKESHDKQNSDQDGIVEKSSPKTENENVSLKAVAAADSSVDPVSQSVHRNKDETERKSAEKGNLKRASSDKAPANNCLKKKKSGKSVGQTLPTLGSKQSSLFNFFQKPPSSSLSKSSNNQSDVENTMSKYWSKDMKNDSQSKHVCSISGASVDKSIPSPSKLNLSTLTVIPTKNDEAFQKNPVKLDSEEDEQAVLPNKIMLQENRNKHATESDQVVSTQLNSVESTESKLGKSTEVKAKASSVWKGLLSGPPPAPPCKGHREPCVLRTVKKAGPNKGKQFYVCARPEGHSSNKEARCDHFQWVNYMSSTGKKS